MRRKQPEVVNLISLLVRWCSQSKVEVVGETKFDLSINEKKATMDKAHVMA